MTSEEFKLGYATGMVYASILILVLLSWAKGLKAIKGNPLATLTLIVPGLIFIFGWLWKGEECSKSIASRLDLEGIEK